MDAKRKLKEAKDAIGKKDFGSSKEISASILENDPDNYNALVFFGLSTANLGLVQESEKAYIKAQSLNDSNPLAYQGMVSLFEKNPDQEKLIQALESISKFYQRINDAAKLDETLSRLYDLYESSNKIDLAISTLERQASTSPEKGTFETWRKLALLQRDFDGSTIVRELENCKRRLDYRGPEAALFTIEKDVFSKSRFGYYVNQAIGSSDAVAIQSFELQADLLEFLWRKLRYVSGDAKNAAWNELLKQANDLVNAEFPSVLSFRISIESEDKEFSLRSRETFERLKNAFTEGPWNMIAQASLQRLDGAAAGDIIDIILEGVNQLDNNNAYFAHILLAELCLEVYSFDASLSHAQRARELLTEFTKWTSTTLPNVTLALDITLANIYVNLGDFNNVNRAIEILERLQSKHPEDLVIKLNLGRAFTQMNRLDEAKSYFQLILEKDTSNLDAQSELAWVFFKLEDYEKSKELLVKVAEESKSVVSIYRLACVFWEMGGDYRSKVYSYVVQAIKLDSNFSPAFTLLGKYFHVVDDDVDRAERSFEKGLRMNKLDSVAAECLCEIYLKRQKYHLYAGVLSSLTENLPRLGWPWRRLAYYNLKRGNARDAITAFQNSLRIDSRSPKSWEGLGEAYFREGKLQASLKAFTRAVELKPSYNTFYLRGLTHRRVGMLTEAIYDFEQSLQFSKDVNVNRMPIVKALGESFFFHGMNEYSRGAFGTAGEFLSKALNTISRCTQILPTHSLFGFLGSIFILFIDYRLIEMDCCAQSLQKVIAKVKENAGLMVKGAEGPLKVDILECSIAALKLALSNSQKDPRRDVFIPFYWYELSRAYFYLGKTLDTNAESSIDHCLRCISNAIKADPSESLFMNALGVYARSMDPDLSQHAFIKSMELNPKSPEPWCNYALTCLIENDIYLSQLSFGQAQIIDPEVPFSWFGQALITERQFRPKEALDLCLYASDLNSEQFAMPELYLYASFKYMKAFITHKKDTTLLHSALFALQKYSEIYPRDIMALNLLGLFYERIGMYKDACSVLERSAKGLSETDLQDDQKVSVLENFARALFHTGDFEKSCEIFAQALESGGDAYTKFCFGKSLFFSSKLEESLQYLNEAIESSATLSSSSALPLKSEISLFLAQVLYCCGSDEHKSLAAKQLRESAEQCPDDLFFGIWSSLLSVSLLLGDGTLAAESAEKLESKQLSPSQETNIKAAEALSQYYRLVGQRNRIFRPFAKLLHSNPSSPSYWAALSKQLMTEPKNSAILRTVTDSLQNVESFNRKEISFLASELSGASRMGSLASLVLGMSSKSISQSKRTAHYSLITQPSSPENWITLGLALRAEFMFNFVSYGDKSKAIRDLQGIQRVSANGLALFEKESEGSLPLWLQLLAIDSKSLHTVIEGGEDLESSVAECVTLCEGLEALGDQDLKLQAAAYITLGRTLMLSGDLQSGLTSYKRGLEINPAALYFEV
ncbi:Superkiller protein 3 [Phlyctochytrium planicorne]|nr:Superkiller protein 3 [Phlyctochytrium planicorne]